MSAPKRQESSPKPVTHPITHAGIRTTEGEREFMYWSATAEPLIAAGLARSEWLPGQSICPNICSLELAIDGRRVKFARRPDQSYYVQFRKTAAEREAWEASGPGRQRRFAREREDALLAAEHARREEARALAGLANNAEEYRKSLVDISLTMLSCIVGQMEISPCGHHFTDADAAVVLEHARKIVATLKNGRIGLNRVTRDREITKIKTKTAQADPSFGAMMQMITAGAPKANA